MNYKLMGPEPSLTGVLYQRALIGTHCPFSLSDRHYLPRLVDEFVPGFTTERDDFVI